MNSVLKLVIIATLFGCMQACAKDDPLYRGFNRGIYEGSQQYQDSQSHPASLNPDESLPDYDVYERQREERLKKEGETR
jgi:hypothetical protein